MEHKFLEEKNRPVTILAILVIVICIGVTAGIQTGGFGFLKTAFSEDEEAMELAGNSVVRLECYDENRNLVGTGSAFCAFGSNVFVTNYHLLEDGVVSVTAQTRSGASFSLDTIVACSETNDIVILKTDSDSGITPLALAGEDDAEEGETVTAIESTNAPGDTTAGGIFCGNVTDDERSLLQFTTVDEDENCGGALFNASGEVIGVTDGALSDGGTVNYAISIATVKQIYFSDDGLSDGTLEGFGKEAIPCYTPSELIDYLSGLEKLEDGTCFTIDCWLPATKIPILAGSSEDPVIFYDSSAEAQNNALKVYVSGGTLNQEKRFLQTETAIVEKENPKRFQEGPVHIRAVLEFDWSDIYLMEAGMGGKPEIIAYEILD